MAREMEPPVLVVESPERTMIRPPPPTLPSPEKTFTLPPAPSELALLSEYNWMLPDAPLSAPLVSPVRK